MEGAVAGLVLLLVLVVFAITVVAKSVALSPQAEAAVVERLGRYSRTVSGQLTLLVPIIDRIRARVDLRERVVSFPPQPVITEDNLTLNIDTVVYFQVTNPQAAVYQISNYIVGVEQLTTTTLRNVVGGMTPGADADLPRLDQRPAAGCAGRGHRSVGAAGVASRAAQHRSAAVDPGVDGKAD